MERSYTKIVIDAFLLNKISELSDREYFQSKPGDLRYFSACIDLDIPLLLFLNSLNLELDRFLFKGL